MNRASSRHPGERKSRSKSETTISHDQPLKFWSVQKAPSGRKLVCKHPQAIINLVRTITIQWPSGTIEELDVSAGDGFNDKELSLKDNDEDKDTTAAGRVADDANRQSGDPLSIKAQIDLRPEYASLQQLKPEPGCLARWLLNRRRRQRRWRALELAAGSGDGALVVDRSYSKRFLPLLVRHALINPVEDPALAILMGFNEIGRNLNDWLTTLQIAKPAGLHLMRPNRPEATYAQERLLALERLSQQATPLSPMGKDADGSCVPMLQYWEGEPVPEDIETMMAAWPAQLQDLKPVRMNAEAALHWITHHGSAQDRERFQRCWHPAMQSDFMRVSVLAQQGGVYVDCDTPVPAEANASQRWRHLMHHCYNGQTLALCVNAIRRPGDIRHYVVNCCLWAPPAHPIMERWLNRHRHALDTLPAELVGTPQGIHQLGPELISALVDDILNEPETQLEAMEWQGIHLPRLHGKDWSLLLINSIVYQKLFGVRMSCHASYQSCSDPRDWKVGTYP